MHDKLINRLTDFIQFEREIRAASSVNALAFTACNFLRKLLSYDVAIFLTEKKGAQRVNTISGVSDFDANSPLVSACEALCNHKQIELSNVQVHNSASLPAKVSDKLSAIQLQQLVTVTLVEDRTTLVLSRDKDWQTHELQLLEQISDVLHHAIKALASSGKPSSLKKLLPGIRPDWRWAVCAIGLISICLLYTSPSPRDATLSRMPSSA